MNLTLTSYKSESQTLTNDSDSHFKKTLTGTLSMAKANEYAGAPCRGGDGRGEEYSTGAISTSLKFIGMCCLVATVRDLRDSLLISQGM